MFIMIVEQELKKSVAAEVNEAREFALEGTELPPNELFSDIYSDQEAEGLYIRGCDMYTGNRDAQ